MLPLCAYLIKLLHIEQIRNRSLIPVSDFPLFSSRALVLFSYNITDWEPQTSAASLRMVVSGLTNCVLSRSFPLSEQKAQFKLVVLFYCFCIHELLQSEQFCLVAVTLKSFHSQVTSFITTELWSDIHPSHVMFQFAEDILTYKHKGFVLAC